MDYISAFITAIVNNGIIPKDTKNIVPTDRFKRIAQNSDKSGKRSISYWLRVEHDFAYGYARDFKTGLECKFRSYNNDQSLTRSDLSRIKLLLKEREAEQNRIAAERHAKIAIRAAHKWAVCKRTGSTPYLVAKNIPLASAGIYGENQVLVPIYEELPVTPQGLVSWQIIYADGTKHFPFGGKKQGCFHIIGQIDPTRPIIICEGFATGVSLNMATKHSVVVAFDAGNLIHVARKVRKYYKNTEIIIAADNDKSKTGQKAAANVKNKVDGVTVIICPDEGCDFNDIDLERVKACFGIQSEEGGEVLSDGLRPIATVQPAESGWRDNLLTNEKGYMLATSMQNILLHTVEHENLKGVFAYDEFKQTTLLAKCPPWLDDSDFTIRPINDNDVTITCGYLERFDLAPSYEKTYRAIQVAADANKFNSAQAYISGMEWDGVERLDRFLADIGCDKEHPDYLAFTFKKWMTAAVKRIMEPGCQFDHLIILESQQQGFYKSTMLKELATFNGESYHTESFSLADIGRDYATLKLQGVTFVELSELSGFNNKDDETIRQWITSRVDEVKLPYERTVSRYKRKFVLCATTNNYDYLKDPSGNRRYWPITICKPIDIEFVRNVKSQLWAEAMHWYKQGLYIGPTLEENKLADIERQKRMQSDAWEDLVLRAIEKVGVDEFRTLDILANMELKTSDKNERAVRRVSSVLKSLGYSNNPQWDSQSQKSVRVWSK